MRIKLVAGNWLSDARQMLDNFALPPRRRPLIIALIVLVTTGCSIFTYYYAKYARIIDQRLQTGVLVTSSAIYAAPKTLMVGEDVQIETVTSSLRRSGFSESETNRVGWYRGSDGTVEIHPGPDAYRKEGAAIRIQDSRIAGILSIPGRVELTQYSLEPEIITNVFDRGREKRVMVGFNDIPKPMVTAILAAEDKHFFRHHGFDLPSILRALWVDLKGRRDSQGASTLRQQLARTLWLGPERGWRRKIPETLITLHLERVRTKRQILEDYVNSIYLGHAGSFSIHGFAKASNLYLGKDLSQVTVADAALLAGMVQAPETRNPLRHPDRAMARRNAILKSMLADGFVDRTEYQAAVASPVNTARGQAESTDAPYFVDLVNDALQNRFEDYDFLNNSFKVYTSLDMDLQRDAVEAVRVGIRETDQLWKRRSNKYGTPEIPLAQVALVALDTQTGEIKALVGGRSYNASQLDRAVAKRQPGSSFKPFVYAAALSTALNRRGPLLMPASTVEDEPTTFYFGGKPYEPGDYEGTYAGPVTLRYAFAHSLNVPAVKIAETVGFDKVAQVGKAAGLNPGIKPTPAIALGAYEVTPIEIARAYTIFANNGSLLNTSFIKSIRDEDSKSVFESQTARKQVLDPRVAYLVESMMEEVVHTGTGAGVRARRFYLPAAGKTGTSRDGWFAGFTSKLICVVWVGFDDNRNFMLEGARSALPIWVEFMKRAHQHPAYKNVHAFKIPKGIVTAEIDAETGELATANCPKVRNEVFIEGTQPVDVCQLHNGSVQTSPTIAVAQPETSRWEDLAPRWVTYIAVAALIGVAAAVLYFLSIPGG